MIPNVAFGAALSVFLIAAWIAGELSFLAPYKAQLFRLHAKLIAALALLVFLNFFAIYYTIARWLFLRDTGRKLLHLDRQLATGDSALEEIRSYLNS